MWRGLRVLPRPCVAKKQVAAACAEQLRCTSYSSSSSSTFSCGEAHGATGGGTSSSSSSRSDYEKTGGENDGGFEKTFSAATAGERRRIARNWENAFFGRVHYEPGMHEQYQSAVESEDAEAGPEQKSNRELFPDWPEDEEAPLHEFRRLPDALKKRYIINRLSMGERRILYAPDYGSLLMMQHLNLGELMINEAERLLVECGWLNETVGAKIAAVRDSAAKVKFDFDLD
ncbi:hypothetical protein DQ04_03821060 [Trypanosoma grayi]|uniref:hypothetical protein n=1 Tax=Trypanosoma grayi TaxID=71804 RepID=UPI0004F45181|nr:hypothetical protein DQ04_03821060 [Trypanosoma grayi]KEG10364.1 hypothetical protein DQ04_03821060 [Trypanosoma grayi]